MRTMILALALSIIPLNLMALDCSKCGLDESGITADLEKIITEMPLSYEDCGKMTEAKFDWGPRNDCERLVKNETTSFENAAKQLKVFQRKYDHKAKTPAVAKLKKYIDDNMEAFNEYTRLKNEAINNLNMAFYNIKNLIQDTNVVGNCGDEGLAYCNAMLLSGANVYRNRSMSDSEPAPKYRLDEAGMEKLLGKVLKNFSPEGLRPEKLETYNEVKKAYEKSVASRPVYNDFKACFEEFERKTVKSMLKQVYVEIIGTL